MNTAQKVAIITGGASRMSLETAKRLASSVKLYLIPAAESKAKEILLSAILLTLMWLLTSRSPSRFSL